MQKQPAPQTVKTPAENFTGDVFLDAVFGGEESPLTLGLVRFTPGARTHWHSHAEGQLLRGTDGAGLVVSRDGTVVTIRAGEAVWTPPGEEHWHGATAETMMCHEAILTAPAEGEATTWLEPVTDEEYAAAQAGLS